MVSQHRCLGGGRVLTATLCLLLLATGCTDSGTTRPGLRSGSAATATPTEDEPPTASHGASGPAGAARHVAWRRLRLQPGWGPDWGLLDRATETVRDLPVEVLAGQVIVARYRGTGAPLELVDGLHLGGVVSFESNLGSAEQVRAANRALQRGAQRSWPVWIGVDQEGGRVTRIRDGVTLLPNQMALGAVDDADLTARANRENGRGLAALGFNVDFAPVADVTDGLRDVTIRARSFGSDPVMVGRHTVAAARGLWDAGVVPVVKHFPGHGRAAVDSHVALPEVARGRTALRSVDMLPFGSAVEAGVPAVMVGHLVVSALDPRLPASLSRRVITRELRGRLGFHGVVVSDALDMGAISGGRWRRAPAVLTLLAGGDVVLMPADPVAARDAIVAAVGDGTLPRRRLEQAAARQIALLLLRERELRRHPPGGADDPDVADELARRSLVLLSDRCSGPQVDAPLRPRGDEDAVRTFREAAERAGVDLSRRGTVVELVGWDGPARPPRRRHPDVVISVADAAVLRGYDAPVRVAAWGWTPATMAALVDVLLGRQPSSGVLPVDVPGLDPCPPVR